MKTAATHHDGHNRVEAAHDVDVVTRVKDRLAPVDTWVRELARDRPLVALAGAVGVGYLLGRLIRRL